jgi:hypothetical protein
VYQTLPLVPIDSGRFFCDGILLETQIPAFAGMTIEERGNDNGDGGDDKNDAGNFKKEE